MKSEPKAFASLSSGLLARKGAARPAMRPQGFGQAGGSLEDLGWNDMGFEAPRPTLTPVLAGSSADDAVEPQLSRTPLAGLTPVSPVHHQQAEIEERFVYLGEEDEDREEQEPFEGLAPGYGSEAAEELGEDDTLELADCLPEAMPARSEEPIFPVTAAAVVPLHSVKEEAVQVEVESPAPPSPTAVTAKAARKPKRGARAEAVAKGKAAFTLRLDPSRHLKLRLACAVNAKSAQQLVTKALDELLLSMPELDAMASQAPERATRKD